MAGIFNSYITGVEAGRGARLHDTRRNAFNMLAGAPAGAVDREGRSVAGLTDPLGAKNALLGGGDYQGALAVEQRQRGVETDQRRQHVASLLQAGDIVGARKAAVSDPDLMQMTDKVVEHARESSQMLASIAASFEGLDVETARSQLQRIKPDLVRRGLDPAQIDAFDPTPENIRSLIGANLSLEKQLGEVSIVKRGDHQDVTRVTPFGATRLSSEVIPETRAEALDRDRFGETRRSNLVSEADADRRYGLAADDNRRAWTAEGRQQREAGRIDSTGQIMAPIYDKIARGQPLTPGEQGLYNDSQRDTAAPNAFGLYGPDPDYGRPPAPVPVPPRAPQTRPAPARGGDGGARGTSANPYQPRSKAEAAALPAGTWFRDPKGNLIEKR